MHLLDLVLHFSQISQFDHVLIDFKNVDGINVTVEDIVLCMYSSLAAYHHCAEEKRISVCASVNDGPVKGLFIKHVEHAWGSEKNCRTIVDCGSSFSPVLR